MARILVFGGSGFIGRHLVKQLTLDGHDVTVADSNIESTLKQAKSIYCDVALPIEISGDFDIAINLAAIHRTPGHNSNEYYETNVGGAINIVNWCRQHSIQKIFFMSSISVYGTGDDAKTENSPLYPVTDYGYSKKLAEAVFLSWKNESEKNQLFICRPAVIFGKGENGNFTRLARFLRRKFFVFPGGKNTLKSAGYVKDLVRSVSFVLSRDYAFFIYNFAFPKVYSIGEIVESFGKYFKIYFKINIPLYILITILEKFGGIIGDHSKRARKLIDDTNVLPKALSEISFDWKYDLAGALDDWHLDSDFDSNLKQL